jgi:acetyl esterase/lipase
MSEYKYVSFTATVVFGIICFYVGLNVIKSVMMYHPTEYTEDKYNTFYSKLLKLTRSENNVVNRLVLSGTEELDLWYIKNPYAKNTILFFHGNAGNVAIRYEMVAFLYSFASVVMFDYRSFGASTGSPYKLTGKTALQDCSSVWDYCVLDLGINPDKIILMGESLGCSLALGLAVTLEDNPKAIILNSPFYSINQMILDMTSNLGISHMGRLLNMITPNEYESDKWILEIDSTIPIIIAHSRADEIIPYAHSLQLFQLIESDNPNAKFLTIGGTHNNLILTDEYVYSITQYMQ